MKATTKSPRPALACARCRRQKLKCDPRKPCTLCLHAGASCEPQTMAERSRLNHKRLFQSNTHKRRLARSKSHSRVQDGQCAETAASRDDDPSVSPLHMTYSSLAERRDYIVIGSSMEFAKTVIGDGEVNNVGGDSPAHGSADFGDVHVNAFTLVTMSLLPQEVIGLGVEAYFDRLHWFVLLLHEPSLVARATSLLSRTTWAQDELCDVILVLTVSLLGLQCVSNDPSWPGHQVLESHSVDASGTVRRLLREVSVHFYEVMMQSRIETYQIIMLLDIYHVYFGSHDFAAHMAGVPARVAHRLGLHCNKVRGMDNIAYQVGIRCWNHAVVGELFASMIFGEPSSLQPAFSRFRTLSELDETPIPKLTAALPILATSRRAVSTLTFHVLKIELYEVIQGILERFKGLHLQKSISIQDLTALTQGAHLAEGKLAEWSENLPTVFNPVHWEAPDPWTALQVQDMHCTPEDRSSRHKLALQGIVLQILHDSAIILAHRPLLQCRISVPSDDLSNMQLQRMPDSLNVSAEAALRISRRPISDFKHQLALSFIFMHLFSAGVILCVPPVYLPYSPLATESKAGVLRIISASRAMGSTNSTARYTDLILTKLYQKTMQREMDGALRASGEGHVRWSSQTKISDPSVSHPLPPTELDRQRMRAVEPSAGPETEITGISFVDTDCTTESQAEALPDSLNEERNFSVPSEVSYLQFGSLLQDDTFGYLSNDHLDDAFGALNQMYDLRFAGETASYPLGYDSPHNICD